MASSGGPMSRRQPPMHHLPGRREIDPPDVLSDQDVRPYSAQTRRRKLRRGLDCRGLAQKRVPADADVEQRTFSGQYAAAAGQPVLYVTERCVFQLTPDGLELTEIAPGADLENDVLAHIGFEPIIGGEPKLMDARIFAAGPMGLKDDLLTVPLEARFAYDAERNIFFLNMEGMSLVSADEVQAIGTEVGTRLAAIGKKVQMVINYDNFYLDPALADDYKALIRSLAERYYASATRYTTSSFMRLKLSEHLSDRGLAPHIYESRQEAVNWLAKQIPSAYPG